MIKLLDRIRVKPSCIPCVELIFALRVFSPRVREIPAVDAGAVCDRTKALGPAFIFVISKVLRSGAGIQTIHLIVLMMLSGMWVN